MSVPARTTAKAVQDVLGPNYDAKKKVNLRPFIDSASDVVDQVLLLSKRKSRVISIGGLKASTLELIERWLAAHFYCISDPLYMSRTTQGASGSFQRAAAKDGFASTDYGKTAMDVDISGCLKNINLQQFASVLGMGHHPDQRGDATKDSLDDGSGGN
jgi:hypothetical protein